MERRNPGLGLLPAELPILGDCGLRDSGKKFRSEAWLLVFQPRGLNDRGTEFTGTWNNKKYFFMAV